MHILYLNSSVEADSGASEDVRPDDFTLRLPEVLRLEPLGEWFCCLKQCYLGFNLSYPLYLCCSFCSESFAGERKLPVLRVIHKKEVVVYDDCLYIPIRVRDIDQVRVYFLKTIDFLPPNYKDKRARLRTPTHITLELSRRRPTL